VGPTGEQGPQGEQGTTGEQGPQGEQGPPIDNASGFAAIPADRRVVLVDPGVDVKPETVVIATPMANLRARSFWVTKDEEADLIAIRMSSPRAVDTPFSWLLVESDPAGGASVVRVIDIEADAALRFMQDGQQVTDISVKPGERIRFRIANTAGFDHSFYIGTDDELMEPSGTTDAGIDPWTSGVRTLDWTVPADVYVSGLKFGCMVPGHYPLMQGTFSSPDPAS
jgi:hypothetical protein